MPSGQSTILIQKYFGENVNRFVMRLKEIAEKNNKLTPSVCARMPLQYSWTIFQVPKDEKCYPAKIAQRFSSDMN